MSKSNDLKTSSAQNRPFEPIAIVGQSCVLPGALDPEALWHAVESGRDLVSSVPEERWGLSRRHAMAESAESSRDRTWCDRGGYVRDFEAVFDPEGFGLDADEVRGLDPLFRWVLHTGREALRDAEGSGDRDPQEPLRKGVVLGNLSFPSAATNRFAESFWLQRAGLPLPDALQHVDPKNRFTSGLPAHLLAHALELDAGAFALDAACASSLYALKLACDRLHDRKADLMLAGAVSCADDLFIHIGFCALEAMSLSGRSRPFHRGADGLLPAEGAACVALERLDDAVRHRRKILGVIRGIGLSNDGRGRSLLAPAQEGQVRAIRSAYEQSGLSPADISLVECHATGTPVGDATEIGSLSEVYGDLSGVPVGSLKSNLGHLITAAGLAGLLKVLGAMKAGVRPPTLHVDDPNPALDGSPFRLLTEAEPWMSEGPRRAALSAFGFGGNNAHLLVEQYLPSEPVTEEVSVEGLLRASLVTEELGTEELALSALPHIEKASEPAVAVVGMAVIAGSCGDIGAFEQVLFDRRRSALTESEGRAGDALLPLKGLRFPPNDLKQTLPQQLLLLQAAQQLPKDLISGLPRETTGVLMGMGCDAEIARYGLRWRLQEWIAPWREQGFDVPEDWTEAAQDAAVAGLQAAGVLGTMPNIPANRLNNQLNLGGPSAAYSAEELSGLVSLDLAVRALRLGEMDAAVVGAVDLSCEPAHLAAAGALMPGGGRPPGDAAVLLVLRRRDDARRDGQEILALVDEVVLGDNAASSPEAGPVSLGDGGIDLSPRFGHAHAASGLLDVAAAVLTCRNRAVPATVGRTGRPWPTPKERQVQVRARTAFNGLRPQHASCVIREAPGTFEDVQPAGPERWPEMRVISGTDRAHVLAQLQGRAEAPQDSSDHLARLVLVGHDEDALTARADEAAELIQGLDSAPTVIQKPGLHFRDLPLEGETAFVFTGAAAAYAGMGRDLLLAAPELQKVLGRRLGSAAEAATWLYDGTQDAPDVLHQLWGASFLCQAHAQLSSRLGLHPHAAIGYSSGESNSLMALGAWADYEALYRDTLDGGLFTRELGGPMDAVARHWRQPKGQAVAWSNWIVRAPVDTVRQALDGEKDVYLTIVNSPNEAVIGGQSDATARVLAKLDAQVYPLGYPMAAHCPEVDAVREEWLELHRRPTSEVRDVRFYTHADGGRSYTPDRESAAQAILGQALGTVDFPAMVKKAWDDGVRIFVEHGPRGLCSRWIRETLDSHGVDPNAYVTVAWDRLGPDALDHSADTVATLIAAGLDLDHRYLWDRQGLPLQPIDGPTLSFPSHWPDVQLPPLAKTADASAKESVESISEARLPEPAASIEPVPSTQPVPSNEHQPRSEPLSSPPTVAPPSAQTIETRAEASSEAIQIMAPAPGLPSVFFDPPESAPQPTRPVAETAVPTPMVQPVEVTEPGPTPAVESPLPQAARPIQAASSIQAAPVALTADGSAAQQVMAGMADLQARLAAAQRDFVGYQTQIHRQFLELRQRDLERLGRTLNSGAGLAVPTGASTPLSLGGFETTAAPAPIPVATPVSAQSQPAASAADPTPTSGDGASAPSAIAAEPPKPAAPPVSRPSPIQAKAPVVSAPTPADLPGPKIDRQGLMTLASGKISDVFGPLFEGQDPYHRQVRMPEPPFLFADRVTGIQGEPRRLGTGIIWTETDVTEDSWYLYRGRMPGGLMIEAGQADLLLISWQGIDFLNKSERVYRLLGCELTYRGDLPTPGETLKYEIHIDGHAKQGDVRLFFFHYDCQVDGHNRLEVRGGQAGFFTDEELADSAGVLWEPTEVELPPGRVDTPPITNTFSTFSREQLVAFSEGRLFDCMGPGFEMGAPHTLSPAIQGGRMLLLDEVTRFDPSGGPWQRGYLRATRAVSPNDWIYEGHFKNDPCMPGTLMFEVCLQTMSFYMAALGFTVERDGWRFQPVQDIPYLMRCRGQVDPTSKELVYEVFVREVWNDAEPTVFADLLVTVDGLKAFHAEGVGLKLVPDWPMTATPEIADVPFSGGERPIGRPVAEVDGFAFDYNTLLACAWGRPSAAFGEMYSRFDGPRTVARLPGPPYHFMSRIVSIDGEMGIFQPGAKIVTEYDVPPADWYFSENGYPTMPYAVLLEAALQPCGWLASFIGSALTSDDDLQFRNLDGTATLTADILPTTGILRNEVHLTATSASAGVMIVRFNVDMFIGDTSVFNMQTAFGFFPKAAMASQAGLPAGPEEMEIFQAPSDFSVDLTAHPAGYFDGSARIGTDKMLVLDRVTGFWPEAGKAGLGRMRAEKTVDPSEWFFKAHFFQDPVQPGSLGIEAMIQLLQIYMLETGLDQKVPNGRFEPIAIDRPMTWKYRGQVIPKNGLISTQIEITEVGEDDRGVYAVAEAWLWVDGKRIYSAIELGMRIVPGDPQPSPRKQDDTSDNDTSDNDTEETALVPVADDDELDETIAQIQMAKSLEQRADAEDLDDTVMSMPSTPEAAPGPGDDYPTPNGPDELILSAERDSWVADHRPTWTIPALPMMSMVDLLAAAAQRRHPGLPVIGLEDVQVRRWIAFEGEPVRLRTEVESEESHPGGAVTLTIALQTWRESARRELSRFETAAVGKVWLGPGYGAPPAPLADLPEALPEDDPYASGSLFHGPAFQLLRGLHISPAGAQVAGSSAVLDAAAGSVPWGALHPGLLDAATHGIPHDSMSRWSAEIPEGFAAYPSKLDAAHFFGPPPTDGPVRCEARFEGLQKSPIEGQPPSPVTRIQLIAGDRVWADLILREILLPKGRLGMAPASQRRAFLRDRIPTPGLGLSRFAASSTHLSESEVAASDWLPGTVARAYGSYVEERFALTREVAVKDHLSRHTGNHPTLIEVDLATASGVAAGQPLTRYAVSVTSGENGEVTVRDEHPPTLDVGPLRRYWRDYFHRQETWAVEDVYYGLIERYVRRVILTHPEEFRAIYGRPVLFLANHQVGVESLLFSTLASALIGKPTITLAKDEHRTSWLGRLIQHCFSYPGMEDPGLITFFERDNPRSLPKLIRKLGERMGKGERAVMVHSEGTRSLTCRKPVELLSGSFIDMAMKNGAPIVPVRFTGGLPVEPLEQRIEFPLGHGQQDYWFGRPLLPEELEPMKYRDRRAFVLDAMNGTGPDQSQEMPYPGRPDFAAEVEAWVAETGASPEHAAIFRTLERLENPGPETQRVLDAARRRDVELGPGEVDRWLGELVGRLGGAK